MARGPPCLQRQTLGKLQEVAAIIAIDSNIGMTVKAIVLDDGFWQSIIEILHVAMGSQTRTAISQRKRETVMEMQQRGSS